MSDNMAVSSVPAAEPDEFKFDNSIAAPNVNPLLRLHQFLSGRYHWAVILGLAFALVGGITAYVMVKPTYQSVGFIQIKPALSRILYSNEQNSIMPMFDAFVDTQVSLLQSQRAIMLALQSPDFRAADTAHSHSLADFSDNLDVSHPKNTELIQVTFTDRDPALAPIAVKAVIDAYQRISGENASDSNAQKMQVLEERRKTLSDQLKGLNDRILVIGNEFGSDDLDPIYQYQLNEFNRIQTSIHEEELALAYAHAGSTAATQPNAVGGVSLDGSEEAALDPLLQRLRGQQAEQVELVQRLKTQLGSAHPTVQSAIAAQRATDDLIASRLQSVQATTQASSAVSVHGGAGGVGGIGGGGGGGGMVSVKQSELRLAELKALRDQAQAGLLDIGRKALQIRDLKSEISTVQQNLDAARSRIDQLNVEAAVSGRATVLSTGDTPLRPLKSKRLPATGGAAVAGLSFGVGIIALIGAMDRRVKSLALAHTFFDRTKRILGVLPSLPEDLADPDQASRAAYCVHHIRTLLQIGSGNSAGSAFAITSSAPGEGKTSLTHSLGLSYAATGMKTLIIDFDLVGAGLTSRVNTIARRRIGEVLVKSNLITQDQLDSTLAYSQSVGKRLGETLIERGLLRQEELDRALVMQKESNLGLLDVLDGAPFDKCIINAGSPNLSILPRGDVGARHGGQISFHTVQRIILNAREKFDIVLVDTGPILGSLEACIVTAVVDEVLVVVSRGQERPLVDKTFTRLADVGARICGIVFNRANDADMQHSGYSSSYSGQSVRSPVLPDVASTGSFRRLGPVAQAVVAGSWALPKDVNQDSE